MHAGKELNWRNKSAEKKEDLVTPVPKTVHLSDCYYFGCEICWHNYYCIMLNKIIMMLEC